jgi:hypothetical protein
MSFTASGTTSYDLGELDYSISIRRLSVEDIERYGPGIVIDYESPGAFRLLAWVD